MNRLKLLARLAAASVIGSAGAGMVAGASYMVGYLLFGAPPASLHGIGDLFAGLIALLFGLFFAAMGGAYYGLTLGTLPAFALGTALTLLERRRWFAGPGPWLLVGALAGYLFNPWYGPIPALQQPLPFGPKPDLGLLFAAIVGGSFGAWTFRHAERLFAELFSNESEAEG